MFSHLSAAGHDAIMSLMQDYLRNPHSHKVNLGIGLYYDAEGKIPLLSSVQAAQKMIDEEALPHTYPPIEGLPAFIQQSQQLLLGENDARVATIQTLGGSGALKLGAEFFRTHFPHSEIWLSDPTWPNHYPIFQGSGLNIHSYPYYDEVTGTVMIDQMLACLDQLPAHSIVLLHACCHNPTGADLDAQQWLAVIDVLKRRHLIPFIDIAYQGFGSGLEEDVFLIRALFMSGMTFLVSQSFSKNFALYGQRCGALSVVCPDEHQANLVQGQLKGLVRASYSCPPIKGAKVVEKILSSPALKSVWVAEVDEMRQRMLRMRQQLAEGLAHHPKIDAERFLQQKGMFSYTGLNDNQLKILREKYAIYLVSPGRMCVAGLNHHNIEYVIEALNQIAN